MTLKNNIMALYTVITFGLTLIVSLVIGNILAIQSKRTLIMTHTDMYPVFVSHMVKDNQSVLNFFRYGTEGNIPPTLKEHVATLTEVDSIYMVKLWNSDAEVIWSDNNEIIGERFQNNDTLKEALEGTVSYEITRPIEEEHQFEDEPDLILEVYIPVMENGEVVGAVELYERDESLNATITSQIRLVWIIMIAGGLLLYIMLFFLFYRSYKRQKKITKQVKQTEKVTIYALAYQAGLRDEETGKHLRRTTEYVRIIAEELKKRPEYKKYITAEYIEDLTRSAPLHDIGKVGIPDAILKKPGKLTPEEFSIIQQHCRLGSRIIEEALEDISFRSFLDIAVQIILSHHEKWDGSGYPSGLQGIHIPLSARIMAIADVYDALRSKRYYKEPFTHQKSVSIITAEKGKHFDPAIVEAFLQRVDDFLEISTRLSDSSNAQ